MIIRQPNGKLFRYDQKINRLEVYNMTEQEFIHLKIKEAIKQAEKEAKEILSDYVSNNFNCYLEDIPKNILEEMKNPNSSMVILQEKNIE